MSDWISVKDRLPEKGQTVLIYTRFYQAYEVGTYMPFEGDDKPIFRPGGLDIERNVTYWMPLPEPPEEGC